MLEDIIHIGNYCFSTLIAVSEDEQRVGLMGHEWPPPIMCFPMRRATYRKFWMKNTPSSLDIVFARNNKIIGMFKGEPLSTQSVGPDLPSDLVIELPYGTAKKLNISIGDDVKLCISINTMAKFFKLGLI